MSALPRDAMRFIDAETTRRHLPFGALIAALRERFAEGCEVPLRHTHRIGDDGTLLLMPAWRAGARLGLKTAVSMRVTSTKSAITALAVASEPAPGP